MVDKEKYKVELMIRILGTDIPGNKTVYAGLTKIRGVSWSISNAVCKKLKLDKERKIGLLTEEEIEKITGYLKNPSLPSWLLNRKKDFHSGEDKHLVTTNLDLQKEFDIRGMKKIKSYKGVRHTQGLPVRGQRTKAHFRKGKAIGVSKQKQKPGKRK